MLCFLQKSLVVETLPVKLVSFLMSPILLKACGLFNLFFLFRKLPLKIFSWLLRYFTPNIPASTNISRNISAIRSCSRIVRFNIGSVYLGGLYSVSLAERNIFTYGVACINLTWSPYFRCSYYAFLASEQSSLAVFPAKTVL